jgi:hypothetical protein
LKEFYTSIEPFLTIDEETSRPNPRGAKLGFDRKAAKIYVTCSLCGKKWTYDLMVQDAQPVR